MPHITVHGERIYYAGGPRRKRPLLLAIHGAGGDHRHWPDDLRKMEITDTVVVDLPAHGKSSGRSRRSVGAYADFIESLVDVLQVDAVTLAGHSMGGAIVLTLGLRQCSWLRRVILVGTGAKLRVEADILRLLDDDYPRAVERICGRAFAATVSDATKDRYRENMLQTPVAVTRNDFLACDGFDVMANVGDIDVSTLIVSGALDELTPPKYGNYLQNHIRQAAHTIIPDVGHMIALENPAAFIEAVAAFMA